MSSFSNILLIDSHVQSYQTFVDSVNANTFPIVFSSSTSKSSILSLMQEHFTKIDRIGIVFEEQPYYMFLDNQPLFTPNEVGDFSENVQFIIEIIKLFNVQNIDYLGCNTLNLPHWKEYYDIIQTNTNAIVGASNDATGNIQYGGNWVMESTGTDIELIYFTSSIRYYKYLLGATAKHGFVINSKGVIYGFGNNLCGQLGNDNSTYRQLGNDNSLQQIVLTKMINNTGKTPKLISCGRFHTVVLMTDDTLYSCGQNTYGQLGIGSDDTNEEIVHSSLTQMNLSKLGTEKPVSVKCGGYHTVVFTDSRKVYGCGYNAYGQLLDKGATLTNNTNKGVTILTHLNDVVYLDINGENTVSGIDCGEFHTIYYTDSSIFGFGDNQYGQLGNTNYVIKDMNTLFGVIKQADCGTYRTVIMKSLYGNINIFSCGYNGDGEFGNGTTNNSNTFTQMTLPPGRTPKSFACGERHTIVLMDNNTIWGCGKNEDGQLGIGDDYNDKKSLTEMTSLPVGKTPKSITCGLGHTIVLMTDGSVYGCGYNVYVGTGNAIKSNVLRQMSIANIVGINDFAFYLPQQYIRYGFNTNDLETFYNTSFIQNMPKPPTTYYYINNDSSNNNINNNILYMHGTRKSCNYIMNGVDIGMYYQFDDFVRAIDLGPYDNNLAKGTWGGTQSNIFANARWIWNTPSLNYNNTDQVANVYLWFYYTFYSSTAISIKINVICDNFGELYFNQTYLGNVSSGWGKDSVGIENLANTVVGLNYIRIAAYNGGPDINPAGLLVTVRNANNGTTIANSNSQWAVSTSTTYNQYGLNYYPQGVGDFKLLLMAGETSTTISTSWLSISGSGKYLIAVSYFPFSKNYLSSDAGATWTKMTNTPVSDYSANFRQAWISNDGKFRLYTVNDIYDSKTYSSSNNGAAYTTTNGLLSLQGAFVSDDGKVKLTSSNYNEVSSGSGYIYRIYNQPDTNSFSNAGSVGGASMNRGFFKGSSSGQYIINQSGNNGMQFSNNYGATWSQLNETNGLTGSTSSNMVDMAISGDGKYMIISGTGYKLWLSTNYGSNWTIISGLRGLPDTDIYTSTKNPWAGCTVSLNGQYMSVAGFFTEEGAFENKGYVFISSDFGLSWTPKSISLTSKCQGFMGTIAHDDFGQPIRLFILTYGEGIYYFNLGVQLVENMPQYNQSNDTYGTTLVSSNATASPPTYPPRWFSICGTGNYLVAVSYGFEETGRNYVSGDAGNSWSGFRGSTGFRNNHRQAWISRNGQYRLYAYSSAGIAALSTNYGANYLYTSISECVGAFVSNNGSVKLVSNGNAIYTVTVNDSAISLSLISTGDYRIIKGSDDGKYILVTSGPNFMLRSINSGVNFTSTDIIATDMAVSFTGQYMIASGSGNTGYKLWISSNYGANWTEITATNTRINGLPDTATYTSTTNTWGACTISGTGQYMSVAGFFTDEGPFKHKACLFISSDYGVSWRVKEIISTTADPGISISTMSYNDNGVPIRIFIATFSKGIFYIDF